MSHMCCSYNKCMGHCRRGGGKNKLSSDTRFNADDVPNFFDELIYKRLNFSVCVCVCVSVCFRKRDRMHLTAVLRVP